MLRRRRYFVGLLALGSAWEFLLTAVGLAGDENQTLPLGYEVAYFAGPLAVAACAYWLTRRAGRSRGRSAAEGTGLALASVVVGPLALLLAIWALSGFAS